MRAYSSRCNASREYVLSMPVYAFLQECQEIYEEDQAARKEQERQYNFRKFTTKRR